eukprot:g1371.t1
MSATIDASAVAVEIDESTKISDDSKWQFEAHAVSAVRELRALWTEIGLDGEAQSKNVENIRNAVIQCFEGAVEETRENVESMRKEIETNMSSIESLKEELGMPGDSEGAEEIASMALNARLDYSRGLVEALGQEKASWVSKIDAQREKLNAVCRLLGKEVPEHMREVGALTDARISEFLSEIRGNESELANRAASVNKLIDEIRAFWDELDVKPSSELERRIAKFDVTDETTSLGLTMEVIEALSACAADFAEQKRKRLDEVRSLGAEITKLWAQLKVSTKEQDAFKSSHAGIGIETVHACESELLRLRKIKEERLGGLIKELRASVDDLHEKVHAGPQQKEKYGILLLKNTSSKSSLYDALDSYIATLRKKLEQLNPLLTSIAKWEGLVREREEYDRMIQDPSRLLSRRSGKELNKELKMAKRVQKHLPALYKKLKQRIVNWEKENDALWIGGRHFLDHMQHVEEAYAQMSAEKKAKKKANRKKKFENDLRHGSKPEKRISSRKSFAPKRRAGPLASSNSKSRATVGGNVCRLGRRGNKEN